jgi:hypothetical protein
MEGVATSACYASVSKSNLAMHHHGQQLLACKDLSTDDLATPVLLLALQVASASPPH